MTKTKKPKLFRKVLSSIMAMAVMTSNFAGTASVFADELSSDNSNSDVMIINNDGTGVEILGATDDMPFEISSSTDDLNITTTATEALTSSATETETELSETETAFSTEFTDVETEIAQGLEETDAEQVDSTSTEPVDYENLTEQEQIELFENEAPPVEVEKDNSVVDMADYILANINPEYAKADKLDELDILLVKQTMAIGSMLPDDGKNLDTLWFGADGAYQSAFVNQAMDHVFLYNTDDNSDYYVAYANTAFKDESMTLAEVTFAYNNLNGEVVEDCIYDENTGLVYVPKKYTEENKNECGFGNIQVQFFQLVDDYSPEASFEVVVDGDNVDGDVSDSGIATADANDMITSIQLAEDKDAVKDIKAEDVNVIVNGVDTDEFIYDEENGVVLLNQSPVTVNTVEIDIDSPTDTERAMTWVLDNVFGGMSAEAAAANGSDWAYFMAGGSVKFDNNKRPMVSDYFEITSSNYAYDVDSLSNTYAPTPSTNEGLVAMVNAVLANATGGLKDYANTVAATYFASYVIPSGTKVTGNKSGYQYVFPKTGTLSLACSHIDRAYNRDPSIGTSVDLGSNSMLACRVLGVYDANGNAVDATDYNGYMIIGVASDTIYTQTMTGAFRIAWETTPPPPPTECVVKVDKDYSTEDAEYARVNPNKTTLKGAFFELINKGTNKRYTAYTDANGVCYFKDLPAGNYVLTELSASRGCEISPDSPWTFTLTEGTSGSEASPNKVIMVEEPVDKNSHIVLNKQTAKQFNTALSNYTAESDDYNFNGTQFMLYHQVGGSTTSLPAPVFVPYEYTVYKDGISDGPANNYFDVVRDNNGKAIPLDLGCVYTINEDGKLEKDTSETYPDGIYVNIECDDYAGDWFRFVECKSSDTYELAAYPNNVVDIHCNANGTEAGQYYWKVKSGLAVESEGYEADLIDMLLYHLTAASSFNTQIINGALSSYNSMPPDGELLTFEEFCDGKKNVHDKVSFDEVVEDMTNGNFEVLTRFFRYTFNYDMWLTNGFNNISNLEATTLYGMFADITYLDNDGLYYIKSFLRGSVTFDNKPILGDLEIIKADTSDDSKLTNEMYYSLEGAKFTLKSVKYPEFIFRNLESGKTYFFDPRDVEASGLYPKELTQELIDEFKEDYIPENNEYELHDKNVLYVYNVPIGDYELIEEEDGASLGHDVYEHPMSISVVDEDNTVYGGSYIDEDETTLIAGNTLYEPHDTGTIELIKQTADDSISCGSTYDLGGAVYGVFDVDPLLNPNANPVVTGETEYSPMLETYVVTFTDLLFGKYWVKEISNPHGYDVSDKIYAGEITEKEPTWSVGESLEMPYVLEEPLFDPIETLLVKEDANTGSGKSSGMFDLSGAEFTVYYYDEYACETGNSYNNTAAFDTIKNDIENNGGQGAMMWVTFKSAEDGADADGNPIYKVRTSNIAKNEDGSYKYYHSENVDIEKFIPTDQFKFPLGTIVIKETKAPDGYVESDELFFRQIEEGKDSNGDPDAVQKAYVLNEQTNAYEWKFDDDINVGTLAQTSLVVPNESSYVGLEIGKQDFQSGNVPQGNADLWAEFTIYNKSEKDGQQYSVIAKELNDSNVAEHANAEKNPQYADDGDYGDFLDHVTYVNTMDEFNTAKLSEDENIVIYTGEVAYGQPVARVRAGYNAATKTSYTAKIYSVLAPGVYEIKETAYSKHYKPHSTESIVKTIANAGRIEPLTGDDSIDNVVERDGVMIDKVDRDTGKNTPQGNATFEGAKFTIYNNSTNAVWVDINGDGIVEACAPGEKVAEIITDATGVAKTAAELLPIGKYYIEETETPMGYNKPTPNRIDFEVTAEDVAKAGLIDLTQKDEALNREDNSVNEPVKRGSISLGKIDAETAEIPQGNADLWADLVIINESKNPVTIEKEDGSALSGWSVASADIESYQLTHDNNIVYANDEVPAGGIVAKVRTGYNPVTKQWYRATLDNALPVGNYTFKEVACSGDYHYAMSTGAFEITEELADGGTVLANVSNEVKRGGVKVYKTDAKTGLPVPQGNGAFENAEFTIYNLSEYPVVVSSPNGDRTVQNYDTVAAAEAAGDDAAVFKIETDDEGVAILEANSLPIGKYAITETKAPHYVDANGVERLTGYDIDINFCEIFEITATDNDKIKAIESPAEQLPWDATLEITKVDATTGQSVAQGESELWAKFAIINTGTNDIWYNGEFYGTNEVITTVTANADNNYKCVVDELFGYSTYIFKEVDCSDDYVALSEWTEGKTVEFASNGDVQSFVVPNVPRLGDVSVQKFDWDTVKNLAQGDATLEGAEFAIICRAPEGKTYNVNGVDYKNGDEIMRIKTDAEAFATTVDNNTENGILPKGHYELKEVAAPKGYVNEGWSHEFTIGIPNPEYTDIWHATFTDQPKLNEAGNGFTDEDGNGVPEKVITGGVQIAKFDWDKRMAEPQGDAELWATFKLTNESAKSVTINGVEYPKGAVIADNLKAECKYNATTKKWTIVYAGMRGLPYGTYKISETGTCDDYTIFGCDRLFSIRENGQMITFDEAEGDENLAASNFVKRGSITVSKFTEGLRPDAVGDATLYNAEFTIWNLSRESIMIGDAKDKEIGTTEYNVEDFKNGKFDVLTDANKVGSIYTNTDGVASMNNLPIGTYIIRETTPPEGYELNKTWFKIVSITADDLNPDLSEKVKETVIDPYNTYACPEKVIAGSVRIEKFDKEFNAPEALYNKALEGVEFEIINRSAEEVIVGDEVFKVGDVISNVEMITRWDDTLKTYVAEAKLSRNSTAVIEGNELLPYGTYEIREIGKEINGKHMATSLYLASDETYTFSIRQKNEVVSVDNAGNDMTFHDTPVRADVKFIKLGEDSKENINRLDTAWLIVDQNGEKHIIRTNKDGEYDSHYSKHDGSRTAACNVNDGLLDRLTINEQNEVVVDGNAAAELILKETENQKPEVVDTQLWFGTGEFGTKAPINDTLGALPYGTYTFYEIPSDTNHGYSLISFDVVVDAAGVTVGKTIVDEVEVNYDVIDMGEVVDTMIEIKTVAQDPETKEHFGYADTEITIVDTVECINLEVGTEYTLKGILMNQDTNERVLDADGNEVTSEIKFVAEEKNCFKEVTFTFNAPADFAGTSVVVFEDLYDGEKRMATHANITDENQTINYPKVWTNAIADATNDHDAPAKAGTIIRDTVSYENLTVGKEYTINGILMDREANDEALDANGKEITSSITFTPTEPNGEVEIVFEFDASNLGGHTLVAYESLEFNGVRIALHADIEDKNQTVHFPKIGTSAEDALTKTHQGVISEQTIFVDTVKYENLIAGREYTISGKLMIKDTNTVLKHADGSEVTSSVTFTAQDTNGEVQMQFVFDSTLTQNKDIVAFEYLDRSGIELAVHADINDEEQTNEYPQVGTSALYGDTKMQEGLAKKDTVIKDTVEYKNLIVGEKYEVQGVLMNKDTETPALDANGKEITASATFTAAKTNGTVVVEFKFDASNFAGETFVVFEELYYKSVRIAAHKEFDDKKQTINFPKIETTLLDSETNDHEANADEEITLIDTVEYENLTIGEEYTMSGVLMDKKTNAPILDDNGKQITATKTFKAEKADGIVEIEFKFKGVTLKGKTTVAFETLTRDNIEVAVHTDINDEEQTVRFPKIRTRALNPEINAHQGVHSENAVIIDTVEYENVTPNKSYKLKGILMNPATGETITDENGNPITAETSFVPTVENGTTEVEFRFNSLAKSYYDIVVFEYLFSNDITVATHTDINDKDQLMEFAHIGTQALYGDTQMQEGLAKIDAVINDTVKYENLIVGKDYRLIGTLMNQATGSPVLDKDGKEITSQVDFKPETTDGEIVVPFKFDATDYAGETFVVFEKLYFKALTEDAPYVEITKHEDITDKGQTINFPDIETTLLDTITNTHEAFATETIKLVDTVSYENLTVGKTYVMNGVLMDKETGNKMLDDNGNEITGSTEFTPTEPDGEVEVVFEFSGVSLAGKSVVAFEDCTRDDITVAIHTDIEDEDQTVDFPKIGTKAVDSLTNDHYGVRSENAVIIDTVEYENLNPNEEYVLKGVLMNKDTNEPITHEDGTPVTAETTFTPSETDGVAEVVFEFNSLTIPCFNLVVFEDLYHNDFEVATHSDIEDEEQSVGYSEIKTKAVYGDTGRQEGLAADEVVIYDTVTYKNFKVGDDYIITGKLVSKETGEDAIDANGNAITGETVFTPETPDGEVIVEFKFNASEFGGQTFVVFEKAYRTFGEGEDITRVEMTSHEDINDDKQTINFPKIETELLDGNAGTHEIIANETVELVDTVTYENLTVGEEYTMNGVLMNKETGEPMLDAEGNEIKSQTVFTPEEPNGVVGVIFTFNGVNLAGETVVAFEDCKHGDITVAVHTDIEDEDQTVKFPKIQTLLHKYGSDDKSVYRHDKIVLVDEVMYENLTIGNSYTVRGVLMDKDTKEAVKDVDGNPITAETSFVAVTEDGTTSITFEFDGTVTDALTVVAFDELYAYGAAETEDDAIADSTEPNEDATEDATEESTESTEENTEATDATEATEESTEETQDATEVTDTMTRQLADNGIAIMADEETTEATEESAQTETTEAIAESTDTTDDITSETEASSEEESTESTDENADNGVLVAAGKDFEDENETMTVIPPEMGTVALDKNTEDHRVMKSEQAVLVDTVNYENLNPGTEYTVKGVLMDKETGEALLDKDGKTINAETIFTPEQPNGSVEVTFTFDSTLLMGKTIVVFEDLYIGERLVLTHADIEDTEQTVYVLSVDTKATGEDDRSKTIPVGKKVIIEDRITFKNFVIGEEYWVEGQLMNKKTGEPVGKPVIAWFVPDKTSGVVTIVFELDTTGLMDETLVCFETVTDKEGNLLAEHKDINDEDQSVKVEVKTEVQTGIQQYSRLAAQIAMAAMLTVIATLAFIVLYKKRKMAQLKKSNK